MTTSAAPKDSDRGTFHLCSDFVKELKDASPPARAIMPATALDEILARFLEKAVADQKVAKRLVRRPFAPLGTFAARIDAAYGFNLINKDQYQALSTIRAVRNHFAHSGNSSFSDPEVRDICLALNLKHVIYPPGHESDPETRYLMNASAICGHLDGIFRLWLERAHHPSTYLKDW